MYKLLVLRGVTTKYLACLLSSVALIIPILSNAQNLGKTANVCFSNAKYGLGMSIQEGAAVPKRVPSGTWGYYSYSNIALGTIFHVYSSQQKELLNFTTSQDIGYRIEPGKGHGAEPRMVSEHYADCASGR